MQMHGGPGGAKGPTGRPFLRFVAMAATGVCIIMLQAHNTRTYILAVVSRAAKRTQHGSKTTHTVGICRRQKTLLKRHRGMLSPSRCTISHDSLRPATPRTLTLTHTATQLAQAGGKGGVAMEQLLRPRQAERPRQVRSAPSLSPHASHALSPREWSTPWNAQLMMRRSNRFPREAGG